MTAAIGRSTGEPRAGGGDALLTDLYQLTMLQVYHARRMTDEAVFDLFVRRLPESRNLLLACGLEHALDYLEGLRFERSDLDYLERVGLFEDDFLSWLADFRFTGDVYAVPEGTPVFANEPLLEIVAPLPEAQLVESCVMSQVHFATVAASKALRVVTAARGRRVVDFGMRRMHGRDAALKAARAYHIAGVDATSNVLAGKLYDLPVAGTMAHSFIQAHDSEPAAFRDFAATYPETVLLVDTYDTLEGVRNVVRLAEVLGPEFRVRGIRLDSGDLAELAKGSRRILDEAGLEQVEIFASGSLDEHEVERLLREGAPITGFGVGTRMGVSSDAPSLDMAYKLTAYAGRGRLKLAPGKRILPGKKQVFRSERDGRAVGDVVALADERLPGRPLLSKVMEGGRRLRGGSPPLDASRAHAARELERLPPELLGLRAAEPPYPVAISRRLEAYAEQVAAEAMS
ncbi:MAG TPA: nicotinate phosphoribosyltransferase [Longimicrobiales bacterium]|nr:nicotinate phosphoribosyltransferase [Longimicrobiales bacterium]